jgi:hypothetical protein
MPFNLSTKVWGIVGSIVLVISLLTGIWAVDDRYIDASELSQTKQQIFLKFDQSDYDALTQKYYQLKLLSEKNPEDRALKERVDKIEDERQKIKVRIEETLRNSGDGS